MTGLVTILVIAILARYLQKNGGYIEFPFLMAMITAVWLLPQLWFLVRQPAFANDGLFSFVFFVMLAMIATLIGYRSGKGRNFRRAVQRARNFSSECVLVRISPLIALTILGYAIQIAIFSLPPSQLLQRAPTGPLAMLKFFSELRSVSLGFSALLFFRYRTQFLLWLVLANLALYLPGMFLEFKRTQFLSVGLIMIGAYWFSMRKEFSRTAIFVTLPFLVMLMFGVRELRETSGLLLNDRNQIQFDLPTFSEIVTIDWATALSGEGGDNATTAVEVQNAIAYKNEIDHDWNFSLGAQFWNRFVQLYVPGSLFGAETKEMLKIGLDLYDFDFLGDSDYQRYAGSTLTGFLQAYADFSYMGVMVFVLCGFVMGRIFRKACLNDIFYQGLYLGLAVKSLTIFTHDSYHLLIYLPWISFISAILFRTSFRIVAPTHPE